MRLPVAFKASRILEYLGWHKPIICQREGRGPWCPLARALRSRRPRLVCMGTRCNGDPPLPPRAPPTRARTNVLQQPG